MPTAGTYYVWCRVLSPTANDDSYFVTSPSGHEDVYDDAEGSVVAEVAVDGPERTQRHRRAADPRSANDLTFTAGANTLTFGGRESGSELDRILVTSDPNFVPTEGNVTTFPDAPPSNPFYEYIETIGRNDITSGCGGGNYCPSSGRDARPDGGLSAQERARQRLHAAGRDPGPFSPTCPPTPSRPPGSSSCTPRA